MAATEPTRDYHAWNLSKDQLLYLSDRLYSLGISNITTCSERERRDAISASRAIVRLIQMWEREARRDLTVISLGGEVL